VFVLLLATLLVLTRTTALGQTPSPAEPGDLVTPLVSAAPLPAFSNGKLLSATLAREPAGEASNAFSTETPKIYLRWHGESLSPGAKIRCVWIAEDVGKAAPADYHVDEASLTADDARASGTFTLSKPKNDWPEGKYRAEIFVGTELTETLPFTIEKARGD
jgi:hypothetical protein